DAQNFRRYTHHRYSECSFRSPFVRHS
ncbi:K(+)-transporting ATPase subunit F, partial [Dysosmobacter welbionis]